MTNYEHIFIARQDISPVQVDALTEHLKSIVAGLDGKVERSEYWGLKTLAYKIKKNRKGHYTLMEITAPYKAIAEMERQMRLNEDVLRFLTLKVENFMSRKNGKKNTSGDEL